MQQWFMVRVVVFLCMLSGVCFLNLTREKKYPEYDVLSVGLLAVIQGCLGVILLNTISEWRGVHLAAQGAIIAIPVLMAPAAMFRKSYSRLMDFCVPISPLMLLFLKVDCVITGCCVGKYLPAIHIEFPSNYIEMAVFLAIFLIFLVFEGRDTMRGKRYPAFMITYGITNLALSLFHYGEQRVLFGLSSQVIWSAVLVVYGLVWLLLSLKKGSNRRK